LHDIVAGCRKIRHQAADRGREACSPSTGPEASLNRKPQDKRQGNSESSHVPVAETSGLLLPDPFASVVTGLLASPAIWAAIHFWAEAPWWRENLERLPAGKSNGRPPEIRIPAIEWNG